MMGLFRHLWDGKRVLGLEEFVLAHLRAQYCIWLIYEPLAQRTRQDYMCVVQLGQDARFAMGKILPVVLACNLDFQGTLRPPLSANRDFASELTFS